MKENSNVSASNPFVSQNTGFLCFKDSSVMCFYINDLAGMLASTVNEEDDHTIFAFGVWLRFSGKLGMSQ